MFLVRNILATPEMISRADLYFADVSKALGSDWIKLANQFDIPKNEIQRIQNDNPDGNRDQALAMLRLWSKRVGPQRANGNALERALRAIRREDIIISCTSNVQHASDSLENAIHKIGTDQNGFDSLKEELGPSRNASRGTSLGREVSLDVSYDEQDIMKVSNIHQILLFCLLLSFTFLFPF
jgi:ankyrin